VKKKNYMFRRKKKFDSKNVCINFSKKKKIDSKKCMCKFFKKKNLIVKKKNMKKKYIEKIFKKNIEKIFKKKITFKNFYFKKCIKKMRLTWTIFVLNRSVS